MIRWCLIIGLAGQLAYGATQSSVMQYDITWTFDKAYEVGQYANGDYWVKGPVTITSITPDFDGSYNGWEQDPSSIDNQPYDSRAPGFDASLVPTLPLTVSGPSSILKTVSGDLENSSCRPCLRTAAVLTVVSEVPADAGTTLFRPGYFGTKKNGYSVEQLKTELLPQVAPPPIVPDMTTMAGKFQRVQLDHKYDYTCRYIHPSANMPDYGSSIASRNAEGALRLMLDDPLEEKMPLLINMVQFGIDLHAMYAGGQTWPGNGGHMVGRKLPAAFAAVMLDDEELKDAIGTSDEFDFDENHGTYYSNTADRVLYGQLVQSEDNYWMNVTVDVGARTIRDPYGWVDGGREPGGSYQYCCLSLPWKGQVMPVCMMPELADVWNDTILLAYVDRWVAHGTWTEGDPCAPAPAFDRSGTTDEKKVLYNNTRADSGYGTTWGPAPGNAADCHLTSTCDCIRDTDPSDGTGRWPDRDGYGRNDGNYGSNFVNFMFAWYRNYIDTAVDDIPEPGSAGGRPELLNPVSYNDLISIHPHAHVYDLSGRETGTVPSAGLYLVAPAGTDMPYPVMIVE